MRLANILENWKPLLLIFKILFGTLAIVFLIDRGDMSFIRIISPIILFSVVYFLEFLINRSRAIAKSGAVLLMVVIIFVLTEVNVKYQYFR